MIFVVSIFLISFVVAQGIHEPGTGLIDPELKEEGQGTGQGLDEEIQNRQMIMDGNYMGEGGQQIKIQKQTNNRIRLEVGGVGVDCDLNMTQEQVQNKTKLNVKLNNGRNAEIKVMPNTASETALNRLRLKVCSEENNCSIELKEVGQGEETKLAYEMKTQKQSKVFGLFSS